MKITKEYLRKVIKESIGEAYQLKLPGDINKKQPQEYIKSLEGLVGDIYNRLSDLHQKMDKGSASQEEIENTIRYIIEILDKSHRLQHHI